VASRRSQQQCSYTAVWKASVKRSIDRFDMQLASDDVLASVRQPDPPARVT
jgi:hypothetical protein